ncbi:MAG: phosphoheptose isomerase, partial [Propionibacteriaceae bacterium]|nr:phosphoheptose isomerase [Propionibacteriaceae bacterium]
AVIETTCPAPMLAWGFAGLPGWAGPLDLVVAQGSGGSGELLSTVVEAVRRGCCLLVAAPDDSPIAAASASSSTVRLPVRTGDPLAAAVMLLQVLHAVGLGPRVVTEAVARAADLVAETCSPHRDLSTNPAKDVAVALAEAVPVLWGGSVLAARAARRVTEALRHASGRAGFAAPADELIPVLRQAAVPDMFDDPDHGLRPVLVTMEDQTPGRTSETDLAMLVDMATQRGLRHVRIQCLDPTADPVDRYISLLMQGQFAAEYLRIGLGLDDRSPHTVWTPGR